MAAKKDGAEVSLSEDSSFLDLLRPLFILGPLVFVAQICFLVAANVVSGVDNLHTYGDLGNAYIRENMDYKTMSIMERYEIQTRGQQIWYDNVKTLGTADRSSLLSLLTTGRTNCMQGRLP